jgi:LDH2 family malate/lactate/ureidoglycolate dehydrogenase
MKDWRDWREFVLDPDLRLLGLQTVPAIPDANLLVFEHECGSSVSVLADRLRPHLSGADGTGERLPNLFGTEQCRQHCQTLDDLDPCDQACTNARDRRMAVLIQEIKRTGKLPERVAERLTAR